MKKIDCDIVVIVHRIWTDGKRKRGGLDRIVEYFISKGKKVLMIEHPLEGLKEVKKIERKNSVVTFWENGIPKEILIKNIRSNNKIISWLKEIIFNINFLRKNIAKGTKLFSSDPLNNLTGIICGSFFTKRYFHCVDFSHDRFENFFLNLIYRIIFNLTFKTYNLIGVVSLLTREAMIKNACPPAKIIQVPNSPIFQEMDLFHKEPFSLIYTGGAIIEKYDYERVLYILSELKKNFPEIKLYIMGGLNEDEGYVSKVNNIIKKLSLVENVEFTGFLNAKELEKYYFKSSIGLSFYAKNVQYYTKFGDSLKIREYALYGIPTISDGNSATDIEMENAGAGFIINKNHEAVEKISKLLNDRTFYNQAQKNCINWARINDKNVLFKKIEDLLESN